METPTRGTPGQKDLGFGEYVRKIFELISNEVIIALNKWYGLEYREQFFQLAWGPFFDEQYNYPASEMPGVWRGETGKLRAPLQLKQ